MYLNNKKNIYRIIMLVIVTAFVTMLLTVVGFTNYLRKDGNIRYIINSVEAKDLETEILKIRAVIDKYYLKDIDEQKLINGAIKGYVEALGDKYTEYLVGEEWTEMETNTLGHYVGIGVYIAEDKENNQIVIISPMEGSPAKDSGIMPGDILVKVNDVEYTGEQIDVAAEVMKGEPGTTVKLEIKRNEETLTFEVERREIKMNQITTKMLEGNIGYISIPSFNEGTAKEFKEKAEKLIADGATKFVIDVRDNTGGIVSEAIQIAEYLIPKNKVLMVTINKDKKQEETKSKENNFITGDLVLLTNGNSASSTEILAAAIKDNDRGKLVGTRTYGKGVMQQILQLSDGNALKITTDEFKTPNGDKIDGVGIEPHEVVKLITDNEGNIIDTQLQKAVEMLK